MSEQASESINPNVNTTESSETLVVAGGDAPVTFDDLEAQESGRVRKKQLEIKEEAEIKAEVEKKTKPKKETKKEAKEDGVQETQEEVTEETTESIDPGKDITGKLGDSSTTVASNTKFEVKVNGKPEEVTLQEMINNYSGRSHLDKEYNKFKTERQTFVEEREAINTMLTDVANLMKEGKVREAVEYQAEVLGTDPIKAWEEFVTTYESHLHGQESMTEEERQAAKLKEENEYWRRKHESQAARRQEEAQMHELESRAKAVMETNEIDQAKFTELYDELVKGGNIDLEQITPELIGDYHRQIALDEMVKEAFDTQNVQLDDVWVGVDKIIKVLNATHPKAKLSELGEEVTDLISKFYGDKRAEAKLARKIERAQKKKQQETTTPRNPSKEPMFFEDLDAV